MMVSPVVLYSVDKMVRSWGPGMCLGELFFCLDDEVEVVGMRHDRRCVLPV